MFGEEKRTHCSICRSTYLQGTIHVCAAEQEGEHHAVRKSDGYCYTHNRYCYKDEMGTHYGPPPLPPLNPKFDHALPDLDQGADDSGMVFPEETPLPVQQAETFDAWMTRTGGRAETPTRAEFLERVGGEEIPEPFPTDMVNHPPHYNQCGIEVIDVIEAYAADNYHRANAIKYLLRADYKGHKKQDLEKAVWYIQREISRL